jgi:hypothetical protein
MAVVAPLSLNGTWSVREATILGKSTEAMFAGFADHTEAADFVIVHRLSGEAVVMLSHETWKRVLATVAVASGEPVPGDNS